MLSLLLTFFSPAISPAYADVPYEIGRQPITVDAGHKKLNLARCDDADDWYLDGYATARSFPNHKEKLYNVVKNLCPLINNISINGMRASTFTVKLNNYLHLIHL